MNAQDLQKHQWKDRLLVLLTNSTNNPVFKEQIKELEHKNEALKDRKLIIYQVTPSAYKIDISEEKKWIKPSTIYDDLKSNNRPFEILLLGLDGGEKLRQANVLTTEKLFALIDGMPMRRAEMRKNE